MIRKTLVCLKEGVTEVQEGEILTCVDSGPWPNEFPGVVGGNYRIGRSRGYWQFEALGFKCPAQKDYGADWRRFTKKSFVELLSLDEML